MDLYLPLKLSSGSETIILPKPFHVGGKTRVGLVDCQLPADIGGFQQTDTLHLNSYETVGSNQIVLKASTNAAVSLYNGFERLVKGSLISKQDHRYYVYIPEGYFIQISSELALELGLPTLLGGLVKGQSVDSLIITEERTEFISAFKLANASEHLEVPYTSNGLKITLEELGYVVQNDGLLLKNDRIYTLSKMHSKLEPRRSTEDCFLCVDILENSLLNDTPLPILRYLPSGKFSHTFKHVYYKTLRQTKQITSIRLTITDEHGRVLEFQDPLLVTLHFYDVHPSKRS
jgi:hypothetical protein